MPVAMADAVRDALFKHTENGSEPPAPAVRRGPGSSVCDPRQSRVSLR